MNTNLLDKQVTVPKDIVNPVTKDIMIRAGLSGTIDAVYLEDKDVIVLFHNSQGYFYAVSVSRLRLV